MSKFKYEIFQNVTVPHNPGRQGIVIAQIAELNAEPNYEVAFLKVTKIDGLDRAIQVTGRFTESTVDAVQPPPMVTQATADMWVANGRQAVRDELRDHLDRMAAQIVSLEAAAKRRRKASRSRKRR